MSRLRSTAAPTTDDIPFMDTPRLTTVAGRASIAVADSGNAPRRLPLLTAAVADLDHPDRSGRR